MKPVAVILLVLIVFGLSTSIVSGGGYASPESYEEWRPATVAEADSLNVVGIFNRVFVGLTGLYNNASVVYPITNTGSPVWFNEEYLNMGPLSNRCGGW